MHYWEASPSLSLFFNGLVGTRFPSLQALHTEIHTHTYIHIHIHTQELTSSPSFESSALFFSLSSFGAVVPASSIFFVILRRLHCFSALSGSFFFCSLSAFTLISCLCVYTARFLFCLIVARFKPIIRMYYSNNCRCFIFNNINIYIIEGNLIINSFSFVGFSSTKSFVVLHTRAVYKQWQPRALMMIGIIHRTSFEMSFSP